MWREYGDYQTANILCKSLMCNKKITVHFGKEKADVRAGSVITSSFFYTTKDHIHKLALESLSLSGQVSGIIIFDLLLLLFFGFLISIIGFLILMIGFTILLLSLSLMLKLVLRTSTKTSMYFWPQDLAECLLECSIVEIFKFASLNLIGNTYSGGPYTPTTRAVQIGAVDRAQIKGVPYGSRLPWQYNFDINITKGFEIKRGAKKALRFNAFFWVNNVLNTWNVLGVFPYTGQPNDDGFLNSSKGKLLVKTQTDAQSYIDLYKILLNSQTGNWNAPRTIRLGLRLNLN